MSQKSNDWGRLPAVVLAAGRSVRMGEFKPLMKLGGEMLVRRVVGGLVGSGVVGEVIVVVGHRGGEVAEAVGGMEGARGGVRVVENRGYAEGEMLSSVVVGMGALRGGGGGGGGAEGFVLALADQPAVKAETVRMVVEEFLKGGAAVVVPAYRGRRGHPIVMGAGLMAEIRGLGPGETLRTVTSRHMSETRVVEVEDAGVVEDLDTPEDWRRAEGRLG